MAYSSLCFVQIGASGKTGTGTNDSGLWIFSRKEARDEAVVAEVRALATKKGFDVSVLIDIDNTNCNCKPSE